jgi:TRAP-type C4-dicarboxylate transport system permease large subunit
MSVDLLVVLVVALFVALLMIRVPVAFALGIAGGLGLAALYGFESAGLSIGSIPFAATAKVSLAVIPMFIMMGMFAQTAGIPEQLFRIANVKLRKVPGGLAVATVVACAGFGAVTGSSVATAATMGRLSIGQMLEYGYTKRFAAGVVASAGTLGVMIPPSVILVMYGVVTGESIGALLLAGIVPGLLSAVVFSCYIFLRTVYRPSSVFVEGAARTPMRANRSPVGAVNGRGGADRPGAAAAAVAEPPADLEREQPPLQWRALVWLLLIFGIVMGGIYTGIFTATESGAVGALVVGAIMVWELRKRGLKGVIAGFRRAFTETAATSSMMLAVVIGAALFSGFLVRAGVASRFTNWVSSIDMPPLLLIAALIAVLIPLGTILESFSLLLIAVPLIHPIAVELGFDGVWLGILVVKAIEIGLLTPPIGMNAYVVAGTTRGLTVEDTFRGVFPFLFVELLVTALIFVIPSIALWLPSQMAL